MAHRTALSAILSALALSLLLAVSGCDFDSAYEVGANGTTSLSPDAIVTARVAGSVGDGPIVNARLRVFSNSGDLLMTTSSSNTADYSLSIKTQGRNYPLTIVADGGRDLVTQREPDFKLVTTIMKPGNGQTVNLNPYSTLIVKAAQNAGGINEENIAKATDAVVSRYGFGLDPAVVPDPLSTLMDESNVHLIVKASETMGEMIRRTRDALMTVNFEVEGVDGKLRIIDGDDVVRALGADLVDGWVDGKGAKGYDRRIAAVANVASAAVMVEAMANRLHVYEIDATRYMDDAIRQVRPNAPASNNTRNVPIPAEALDQSLRSLRATKVVKNDPRITEIYDAVAKAEPGSTELNALSPGIQTQSSGFHNPLNDAVLATALLYEETKLDEINSREGTGTATDSGDNSNTDNTEDSSSAPGVEEPAESEDKTTNDDPPPENSTNTGTGGDSPGTDSGGDSNHTGETPSEPNTLWKNDGWLLFDGVSDMLNTGLSLTELNGSSFTFEAIVQYNGEASATWTPIFGSSHGPSYSDSEVLFLGKRRSDERMTIYIGGLATYYPEGAGLFDGQQRHTAVTFDQSAGELRFFVDGNPIHTLTGVSGVATGNSELVIGGVGHQTDARWKGWIGPARVSKTALDPKQFLGIDGEPLAPRPNSAPIISDTPTTALVIGYPWSFTPSASDPDGDTLTFSVDGKPESASFDAATGRISWTPSAKGSHGPITITVSDGKATASLEPFTLHVDEPTLGTATVSWEPPTQRTDGSALTDLAGYRVYYGKDQNALSHTIVIDTAGQTSQFIDNLDGGTWYFAVTAVCSKGLESPKSEIGSKTIL
jgi:hypothetical protein